MSGNGHRLISREGVPVLIFLFVIMVSAYVLFGVFSALVVCTVFVLAAFILRDPNCAVPSAPLGIVSPVNGKVVSVSQAEDPWLSRSAIKVRLKNSLWNAHVLRSPIEGKVMNQWSAANTDPEFSRQLAYWIRTDEGDDLLIALCMSSSSVFTRMGLSSGQRSGQGQRCGFLYFAGLIDLYLPENARITVKAGDRLMSGTDIIAHFVHIEGASAIVAK